MEVTAKTNNRTRTPLSLMLQTALVVLLAGSVSGCTSGAFDLFDTSPKVDRSLSTSTIPKRSEEAVSDEVTVRNAVTSADLSKMGANPLPWANTATGSAGVVSKIREARVAGQLCRGFVTTRHSYEGIAKFTGQACMADSGDWLLTSFERQ
ncbi:outer membrane surface antigen [Rhizobium sp. RU35A]|nr:outer membrane surface antigen [Rhizobium sp. RU35A]